tara:strand:+ start:385 stop:693 length:309 start_codon:yes stop_codon:yes gene_type:complete
MANTIKLKRGTSTPSTSDITSGEVAVDTSAQKLYINDSGTVKELGGGGATGGGSDAVFFENGQTVTTNYTITNNTNAMSAGPITINSSITVTIGSGENWIIL